MGLVRCCGVWLAHDLDIISDCSSSIRAWSSSLFSCSFRMAAKRRLTISPMSNVVESGAAGTAGCRITGATLTVFVPSLAATLFLALAVVSVGLGLTGTHSSSRCCCPLDTGNCCFSWAWAVTRSSGLRTGICGHCKKLGKKMNQRTGSGNEFLFYLKILALVIQNVKEWMKNSPLNFRLQTNSSRNIVVI